MVGGAGVPSSSALQAFIFQSGSYTVLGSPAGEPNFSGAGISPNGSLIVGGSHSAGSYDRAWIYDGTSFTQIVVPGFNYVYAGGVTDAGIATGFYYSNNSGSGGRFYGYLYDNGSITTLDISGAQSIDPHGINAANTVVGDYVTGAGATRGFVRTSDGQYFEGQYPGSTDTWFTGISANNKIVGFASFDNAATFVPIVVTLQAVPEPADFAAFAALGAVVVAAWKKRRNRTKGGHKTSG